MGYVVWGVKNETHDLVGTEFVPGKTKVGNEELESWLLRLLTPKLDFRFHEVVLDDVRVIVLEIDRASRQPVAFSGQEFIRVGSYKKKLKAFPEKERQLWRIFDATPFEEGIAKPRGDEDVLGLLDYPRYFELLDRPLPANREAILSALSDDALVSRTDAGRWEITNLGAILFAKRLDMFPSLQRKATRVILYKGNNRVETVKEQVGGKGYASGFEGLIEFINDLLPRNEVLGPALRKDVRMYPEIAIREIVANGLIHQDFAITGMGPMVEIFDDRMEVTSPGEPLMSTDRFVDAPPRSRNEALASLMRRIGVCEERGSGIDKVVFQTELYQLPAPLFEVTGGGDADRPLRTPASCGDGQGGPDTSVLPPCLPSVRLQGVPDKLLAAGAVRDRRQERGEGVPAHQGGGRSGADRPVRCGSSSQGHEVRALVGGGDGLMSAISHLTGICFEALFSAAVEEKHRSFQQSGRQDSFDVHLMAGPGVGTEGSW